MQWRDEYSVGIKRIDEQHKMIFRMAADFRAALDEDRGRRVYGTLLDALSLYCRGHFGNEDRCMEEHRCPAAQVNREEHARFVETLTGFRERYEAGGYDAAEALRLVDTMDRWLTHHICRVDRHLRPYATGGDGAGPPGN